MYVMLSMDWHRVGQAWAESNEKCRCRGGVGERSGSSGSAVQRWGIIWGREVVSVDGCAGVLYVAPKPSDSSRDAHVHSRYVVQQQTVVRVVGN
jgi:hypothetical protein